MVLSSFLITSRETLEAALVVGIVLSYLIKTGNEKFKKTVYYGVLVGLILSVVAAFAFTAIAGGFEGQAEKLFEGFTMLISAVLLTTMILWMMNQKHVAKELHGKVKVHIEKASIGKTFAYGLLFLIIFSVLREGVETVIFLYAISASSGISLIGGILGVITAVIIGYLFFVGSKKIELKTFFNITSFLLILFAAGLVAHGVHELQEAELIPYAVKEVWDINPAVVTEGDYPALHEKGSVGGFLKGLFGYNGNPSLIEVLSYILYLGIIFIFYKKIENRNSVNG